MREMGVYLVQMVLRSYICLFWILNITLKTIKFCIRLYELIYIFNFCNGFISVKRNLSVILVTDKNQIYNG
jgi:hypothetical protein